MGCMMASRNTAGSGLPKTCSRASDSWLMRTSVYSQKLPGDRLGRGFPLEPSRGPPRKRCPLAALGRAALKGQPPIAIHLVGHAEEAAFPFAGLLEQMFPGDGGVVSRVEADAGRAHAHGFPDIRDVAAVVRHAG